MPRPVGRRGQSPCWTSTRVGSRSGSPPSGSASRRPGSCSPGRGTPTGVRTCSTPPIPSIGPASRPIAWRSTRGGRACSTCAGTRAWSWRPTRVHYVSHWITPELAPRRYDTRFFVTAAPAGQVAHHDDGETIATIWLRPGDALDRFAAGEIELLPPTVDMLDEAGSSRLDPRGHGLGPRRSPTCPTILPIVLIEDGRAADAAPRGRRVRAGRRGPDGVVGSRSHPSWPGCGQAGVGPEGRSA